MPAEQPRKVSLHLGHDDLSAGSGGVYEHVNPVSGAVQAQIPLAGPAEIERAVERAEAAFDAWRRTRPEARRELLFKLADLLDKNAAALAECAAYDGGTPLAAGLRGVETAVAWTRYYAGWCDKLTGQLLSTFDTRSEFSYSVPEPIGVVGVIITWNGPVISLAMKVAPALAAGNCVIVKPAELTPFAPDLFADLVRQAGFPDGVVSILPGTAAAGEALVRHPKVAKISFTGGPTTARKIMAACAENLKPSVMELGGKSASLVFPDVDLDAVCQRAVFWSIGILSGQGCALPTRLLVHEQVYDDVLQRLTTIAAAYNVGDPFEAGVQVGPLINAAACDRVMGMLDRVRNNNTGRIVLGGARCGGPLAGKNFIEPTIIADAPIDSEIAQIEVFGPVLLVNKFKDEDEAVRLANATSYGLAAYIQSNDIRRVHRLAERLHAGGVYVNGAVQINPHTPFGGLGVSGFGKEGGRAGLDEFVHYKTVTIGAH